MAGRYSIRKVWHATATRKSRLDAGVGEPCPYCGATMRRGNVSLDHIIPISRGGSGDDGNLRACCKACNEAKDSYLMSQVKIANQGTVRGIILATLRDGDGLRGAWATVRRRGYPIGWAYFDEIVRRTCEEIGVDHFTDGWEEA